MRLIGNVSNEDLAQKFSSFLTQKGIEHTIDSSMDPQTGFLNYPIWIENEDQIELAENYFHQFQKNPNASEFNQAIVEKMEDPVMAPQKIIRRPFPITIFFLGLCVFIFLLQNLQWGALKEKGFTSQNFMMTQIEALFLYDEPVALEQLVDQIDAYLPEKKQPIPQEIQEKIQEFQTASYWRGFYEWFVSKYIDPTKPYQTGPLFTKIREGEIWRIFTPCLLHGNLIHILFNMLWLFVLGRQIEERIGGFRILLFSLFVGIVTNTAQYLMSGPFFLGYSGIILGLAGFIWMREKIAPWEGYPLPKGVFLFIAIYILALVALEIGSFFIAFFTTTQLIPPFANTAHIIGAILGALLGRLSFFESRMQNRIEP